MVTRSVAALSTMLLAFLLTDLYFWVAPGMVILGRSRDVWPQLRGLGMHLEEFAIRNGRYPGSLKELAEWKKQQGRSTFVLDSGKPMFVDPWGNTFQYESDGRSFRIFAVHQNRDLAGISRVGDLDHYPRGRLRFEPSVRELFFESQHSLALFRANIVSSVIAGVLCFFLVPRVGARRSSLRATVACIVTTTAFAVIASFCVVFVCMVLES